MYKVTLNLRLVSYAGSSFIFEISRLDTANCEIQGVPLNVQPATIATLGAAASEVPGTELVTLQTIGAAW
jgi:hypothetical protein